MVDMAAIAVRLQHVLYVAISKQHSEAHISLTTQAPSRGECADAASLGPKRMCHLAGTLRSRLRPYDTAMARRSASSTARTERRRSALTWGLLRAQHQSGRARRRRPAL